MPTAARSTSCRKWLPETCILFLQYEGMEWIASHILSPYMTNRNGGCPTSAASEEVRKGGDAGHVLQADEDGGACCNPHMICERYVAIHNIGHQQWSEDLCHSSPAMEGLRMGRFGSWLVTPKLCVGESQPPVVFLVPTNSNTERNYC